CAVRARSGRVRARGIATRIAACAGEHERRRDDQGRTSGRHADEADALSACAKEPRFHSMPTAPEPLPDAFAAVSPAARRVLSAAPRRRYRTGEILWTAGTDPRGLLV